jgi:hypothetical protein
MTSIDWLYGSCLIVIKNQFSHLLCAVRFALFLISLDLGIFIALALRLVLRFHSSLA